MYISCVCFQKRIDSNLFALLDEKTEADNEKIVKKTKEKPAKIEDKAITEEELNSYLIPSRII